jgi:hypothetical protein
MYYVFGRGWNLGLDGDSSAWFGYLSSGARGTGLWIVDFGLISEIEVNWGGGELIREGKEGKEKGREGKVGIIVVCLFVCLVIQDF